MKLCFVLCLHNWWLMLVEPCIVIFLTWITWITITFWLTSSLKTRCFFYGPPVQKNIKKYVYFLCAENIESQYLTFDRLVMIYFSHLGVDIKHLACLSRSIYNWWDNKIRLCKWWICCSQSIALLKKIIYSFCRYNAIIKHYIILQANNMNERTNWRAYDSILLECQKASTDESLLSSQTLFLPKSCSDL